MRADENQVSAQRFEVTDGHRSRLVRMRMTAVLLAAMLLVAMPGTAPAQPATDALDGAAQCAAAKARGRAPLSFAPGKRASLASANFDATYYHLTLDVRFDPEDVSGHTRVEGRVAGAPMTTLTLDFDDAMTVDSVLSAEGAPLAFTHAGGALAVSLPAPLGDGAPVAVDVYYHGLPAQAGFGTFVFGALANGDPYAWTLSEPYGARNWWPCKDHPSDKADSVRVTVTVPEGLRVGSEGLLVAETPNGDGTVTYDWRSRYPIATYLVSLAAGVYDVTEDTYARPDSLAGAFGALLLPILHYAYRDTDVYEGGDDFSGWKNVLDVLPVLEYWFGPYPFSEEKYGHAHVTFGGGMEHQTMSSMGGGGVGLVTHELGHMWFGDAVTLRTWPHLWLNEGFATYAELLYWKARADRYPGTYEQVFDLYYGRALTAEGTLVVEDTTDVYDLFAHSRVYSKGAMVLRMLRGITGEEVFREILRSYAADAAVRYGTAVTADFERVAEAVSGLDLGAFFRQWVTEGTGEPVYEVGWSARAAGDGYDVTVEITQTQTAPASTVEVFEMPVTLAVATTAGERRFTVVNDARRQTVTLHVDALPTGLAFDPDRWILRGEEVLVVAVETAPETARRTEIAAVYPNPAAGTFHVRLMLAAPAPARLDLFDARGRRAGRLLDRPLPAGPHDLAFDASGLAPGVYFLRLTDGRRAHTRTVTLLAPR